MTCLPLVPHPPCWIVKGVDPNTGSLPVMVTSVVSLVTWFTLVMVMLVMQGLDIMLAGSWIVTLDSEVPVSCSSRSDVEFSND